MGNIQVKPHTTLSKKRERENEGHDSSRGVTAPQRDVSKKCTGYLLQGEDTAMEEPRAESGNTETPRSGNKEK